MDQNHHVSSQPKGSTLMILVAVLTTIIVMGGAFLLYLKYSKPAATTTTPTPATTPKSTPTTDKTTTPAATSTPSTTPSTDLTYSNPTYGFTMTFPATWKGYKFKEANFEGSTITYYVEVPSTDSNSKTAGTTNDAGYYSSFAITVYTLAQWQDLQNSEGAIMATKITQNDKYVFTWSQANGVPATDFGSKSDDIKTIIVSFKLQ